MPMPALSEVLAHNAQKETKYLIELASNHSVEEMNCIAAVFSEEPGFHLSAILPTLRFVVKKNEAYDGENSCLDQLIKFQKATCAYLRINGTDHIITKVTSKWRITQF